MDDNKENEDQFPKKGDKARHVIRVTAHKVHGVSEFAHLGYFATGAGLLHEYHSIFAAACGVGLLVVLVAGAAGVSILEEE